MNKKQKDKVLMHIIKISIIIFFSSIFLLIAITQELHGLAYLFLFFLAVGAILFAIIKILMTIINLNTEKKNTKYIQTFEKDLKKPAYKVFDYIYSIITITGFILLNYVPQNKFFITLFTLIIITGLLWLTVRKY